MNRFTGGIEEKNTEIYKYERFVISVIRVVATIFILLCHLAEQYPSNTIKATGQMFNVGVVIFFCISGYLYGNKHIESFIKWFAKRYLKISVPIIFFVYALLFVTFKFDVKVLLCYVFNLQGFFGNYVIEGAGHLWFISVLMVCYLSTPILQKIKSLHKNNIYSYAITILFIIQLLLALFWIKTFSIYLVYIYCYAFSYLIPNGWVKIISKKMVLFSCIIGIFAMIFRLIIKFIDDKYSNSLTNRMYECVVVQYTHAIFGFCIIIIICHLIMRYSVFNNIKSTIETIDKYSFQIYIVHYMFMVGPFRLMGITHNFLLNTLLTVIATSFTAFIFHFVVKIISKAIKLWG